MYTGTGKNGRASPPERLLVSLAVIVSLIASTRTEGALRVRCELDTGRYPKEQGISDAPMAQLRPCRHPFHGDWNYIIQPRKTNQLLELLSDAPESDRTNRSHERFEQPYLVEDRPGPYIADGKP
jgi:hypothetical protein